MKVLYFVGGLTHYFNRVLSRLNDGNGIEIVAITAAGKNSKIGDSVYQTIDGVNFRICQLRETNIPPFYASYAGLGRLLAAERPDVVVVPDNLTLALLANPFVLFQIAMRRIKVVQQAIPFNVPSYGEAFERLSQPTKVFDALPAWLRGAVSLARLQRPLRWIYLQLKAYSYRWVDAHLNYTDDAKRIYGSYGVPPERIFITLNSPDTDHYRAAEPRIRAAPAPLPPNPSRLIHVGRLVEWKRVDLLIDALAALKEKFPDAELVIIGNGPEEERLRQQVKRLGILESVVFAGGIYEISDLGKYLLASSVYVLAGMGGLSINDAMFFGKPIVCSVCDGTEKMLVREGVNGAFFKEGDLADLVAVLSKLLSSPTDLARMGEASRRIIDDEVNVGTVCDRYLAAFRSLN